MQTYENLMAAARKAHAAGDKEAAKRLLELAHQTPSAPEVLESPRPQARPLPAIETSPTPQPRPTGIAMTESPVPQNRPANYNLAASGSASGDLAPPVNGAGDAMLMSLADAMTANANRQITPLAPPPAPPGPPSIDPLLAAMLPQNPAGPRQIGLGASATGGAGAPASAAVNGEISPLAMLLHTLDNPPPSPQEQRAQAKAQAAQNEAQAAAGAGVGPISPDQGSLGENLMAVPRGVASAVPAFNEAAWNIAAALAALPGDNQVSDYFQNLAEVSAEQKKAVAGDPQSWIGQQVQGASQSVGQMLPGIAASLLSGGSATPAVMAAYLAPGMITQGGQSVGEARVEGKSPAKALLYGAVDAAAEGVFEKLPVGKLLKDIVDGTGFGKILAHQLATEVPTEVATTIFQNLNAYASLHPEKPLADFLAEQPEAIRDTIVQTVMATTAVSGAGALVSKAAGKKDEKQPEQSAPDATPPAVDPLIAAMTGQVAPDQPAAPQAAPPAPKADPKTVAKAKLEAFAAKSNGAAMISGSAPARYFDELVASAEKSGLTSDEIDAALSGPKAPEPAPVVPDALAVPQEPAAPQGTAKPQADTTTPAKPAPAEGQTITEADALANPDRYEILDASEGTGSSWTNTGERVVLDTQTGQVHPLAPSTPAQAVGATGDGTAGKQPQANGVPDVGSSAPPAADSALPETAVPAQIDAATGKPPASWVIRNKETGEVILETSDKVKVNALNTAKYEAVPIGDYLASINGQNAPDPTPQQGAVAAKPIPTAEIPHKVIKSDTAVTPTGTKVQVDYAIVPLDSLTASNSDDGRVNPKYPQERQPRDRTDGKSEQQIQRIMRDFNPRLLDQSPTTDNGAPIVDSAGIVESGNGRTMMLNRMYRDRPDLATNYQGHLKAQGYPVDGVKNPVLVRIRRTDMTPEEIASYTRDSNTDTKLSMSATEQAMTDSKAMPDEAMSLYRGGDIDAAPNRPFVMSFLRNVVPENEHGTMVDRNGGMSQEAVRRIGGAMLAKAYGDADLISKLIEAADNNIKSIGGALLDVSPAWAKMRAAARDGRIAPEMDQTAALIEAVRLVNRARTEGRNVIEYVKQPDLLSGEGISPMGQRFLALMFRDVRQWTKPAGRDSMVRDFSAVINGAMQSSPGADMFGASADPAALLDLVKKKQEDANDAGTQTDLFAAKAPQPDGGSVPSQSGQGNRPGTESAGPQSSPVSGQGSQPAAVTAKTPGESYLEASLAAIGRHAQGTDKAPTSGQDLLVPGDNAAFFDAMAAAKTLEQKQKTASDHVLALGKKAGKEHLVVLNAAGEILEFRNGTKDGVCFTDALVRAIEAGEVVFSVHNHPSNRGASRLDLKALWLGMPNLKIIGHKGAVHLLNKGKAAEKLDRARILEAFDAMEGRLTRLMQSEVNALRPTPDAANLHVDHLNRHYATVIMLALDRAGLIEYEGTAQADLAAAGVNLDDYLPELFAAASPGLGRAGFALPEIGNQGSTGRTESQPSEAGGGSGSNSGSDSLSGKHPADGNGSGRPASEGVKPKPGKTSPTKPATTGNAAIDGALDDIFGTETDNVPSPGERVEPDRGDAKPADGLGKPDVSAAAGSTRPGGGKRTAAGQGGNRKRSGSSRLPGDDAAPVGSGSNPQLAGRGGANAAKPAGAGNSAAGNGGGAGGLHAGPAGSGNPAQNASSGTARPKLTPAERLAAIRNAMKEETADFVTKGMAERTDAPAFKAWFGDSKVVDANGKPLVVYHGTNADFAAFDHTKLGDTTRAASAKMGFFFAASPEVASSYADTFNHYTDTKVGRLLNRLTRGAYEKAAESILDAVDGPAMIVEDGNVIPAFLAVQNPMTVDFGGAKYRERTYAAIIAEAKDKGHDGVILRNTIDPGFTDDGAGVTDVYVAFNPGQIKSTFNRGTWDASNPAMLAEDPAPLIDLRKYETLEELFIGAIEGADVGRLSDRQLYGAIIKPLMEVGMTRQEVANLLPYLELFYTNLKSGRVNLNPDAEPMPAPMQADDRDAKQAKADRIKPVAADEANIRATLPLLLPEQQDDVLKIEKRFAKPDGHGMMVTNGTGTGKTFSGGGQVKRFVQMGKGNILIVAPSDAVMAGWGKALDAMGVTASQLKNTKDAGSGVVMTTYANLRDNMALASRSWDLVVTDESQNLMSAADGKVTGALQNLRAITHRPDDLHHKSHMIHAAEWAKVKVMKDGEAKTAAYRRLSDIADAEVAKWRSEPRSKVLFLSATPFAYDKTVDYAEGYLFQYPKDGHVGNSRQSGQNLFMVENFGYRIRYHKLTKPEAAVDSAVFERQFHEKLVREGVLTGRSLQVDVDYDRKFVKSEDAQGNDVDKALDALRELVNAEGKSASDAAKSGDMKGLQKDRVFAALEGHMRKNFDYLARMQLLESIKARIAAEDIKKHLALGRKVVVFHDFNVGGGMNPFTYLKMRETVINPETGETERVPVSPMTKEAAEGYRQLLAVHPWIADLNFTGYKAPIQHLPSALGKTVKLFNGTIPTKQRLQNLADFNRDGSGIDVLVVQADAGGAGISMHDLTGTHQRVLINLGMPTKPTTTLQEEGRILRVGTMTNAPFRYYTIGTAWERQAFASRIAERSGTVENLALGNGARDLLNGFIEAYEEAEAIEPGPTDGTGGKARDRAAATASPYEIAKTHYFGRTKTKGKRDQREGLDFYPTPEPLGLKMVEWAGIRPNERVLEPSAGDGSIARYVPDYADLTMIEPSSDLASRAQLRASHGKVIENTFESYHLVNKAHVIVMNPPFGSGGKTAMEHLAKAAKHLRAGGRIVALIPSGPSADNRFTSWYESDEAKGFYVTMDVSLPSVTFERASTSVMARVVIIDKVAPEDSPNGQRRDLRSEKTIGEFFNRIEDMDVPARPAPKQDVIEELEAEGQDATAPVPNMRPGPPLATTIDAFAKASVMSMKGKPFPAAFHAAKVERDIYDQMKAVANEHGGWWHKNAGTAKGAGPTFAFRTEEARDAFIADMSKPTVGMAEDGAKYQRQPVTLDRAIVAHPLSAANSHVDYDAAKAGDPAAAMRVAKTLVDANLISSIRAKIGGRKPIVVPVISVEATGRNKIPSASAEVIANRLGLETDAGIVQTNSPKRTAMSGLDRIFSPPIFGGPVKAGADYLLVDDAVTQGATFAALEAHIASNGGRVVGAVALTGKQYSAILRPEPQSLAALREHLGDIEPDFRAVVGYGFDALTESEVRYLTNFKPADAIRNRLSSERSNAGSHRLSRNARAGITPPQLVRDATFATGEIAKALPALRTELDRLDLKRVRLASDSGANWQGMFQVTGDGGLEIVIGASLDPVKTLHHEVIHALRTMNLFTETEWRALELAASKGWIEKHDIAQRYPDLLPSEQIEEAIAEEFSEALATKKSPKGSAIVTAFNKIARIFRAFRTVLTGKGYDTVEKIFGATLAGEIGKRAAFNTGVMASANWQQRQRPAVSSLSGDELGTTSDIRALGKAAEDWYRQNLVGMTVTNASTGMKIMFNRRGARKIGGRKGEDLYRLVPALREILEQGTVIETQTDRLGRDEVKAVHKIGATVRLAGQIKDVVATVREMQDGTFHYDLSMARGAGGFSSPTVQDESSTSALEGDPAEINLSESSDGGNGFAQSQPKLARQPLAVRPLTPQARANRNTGMFGSLFIPDRRVWEELTQAGAPIWGRITGAKGAAADAVDRARAKIQDRFLPILRAQRAIEAASGHPVNEDQDAWAKTKTFSGKTAKHLRDIDNDYLKPIIKIIAGTKGGLTADSVGNWLYARHAEERNKRIASINPQMPDGGSGMMDAEAQQILADAANSPFAAHLLEIGRLIDAMRERSLKLREDAGLITHADANVWRAMYKHYVPLKGFSETDHSESVLDVAGMGRRFSIKGAESKRAMGRRSEAFNPLQASVTQAQEASIRAEKNRVGQALYDLAKNFPSPELWSVKTPTQKRYFNRTTGLVETRVEDPLSMILEPNEMAVKVGGHEQRILFHDERLARAAGTVGADQMGSFISAMSTVMMFWRAVRTSLSPAFVLKNAIRDTIFSQINLEALAGKDAGKIRSATIKGLPFAMAGIYRGEGGKKDTTWSKYYDEFQNVGAKVSFWRMEDPIIAKSDMQRRIYLDTGNAAVRLGKRMISPKAIFSNRDNPILAFTERVNLAIENATRLATYIAARQAGWSEQRAAILARDITLDFNTKGEWGATINALYGFFNAGMQGAYTVGKSLKSRKVKLIAGALIGAGFLLGQMNASLSDRDKDGVLAYDKIPNYQSQMSLQFMLGQDSDMAASIPLPYGFNLFPYLGQQMEKLNRGVKSPDRILSDMAAAAMGAFSPINGGDMYSFLTPSLGDPLLDMARNRDWLLRPIKPDYDFDRRPESQKAFGGATEASKAIAETLNRWTGGTTGLSGGIDISPEYIDYMGAFVTGSAGTFWGSSVDLAAKAMSGDMTGVEINDVPIVKDFIHTTPDYLDSSRYFTFRDQINAAAYAVKTSAETGEPLPAKVKKWATLAGPLKAAEKARKNGQDIFLQFNGLVTKTMGQIAE